MQEGFASRVEETLASIPSRGDAKAEVGLILGSGLSPFAASFRGLEIPYRRIRGFPVPTVEGHAGLLRLGGGVAVLAGRFHYYEGWSMDDIVLPVFLLHGLGVRTLVVTNACGSIRREHTPGQLVLIRDHINLMGANPLRGPNPEGLGPRFPDMTLAYARRLRELASEAAGRTLPEGVYAAFAGPSYETPAEVRMAERLGADLVGMSTVPEVIAARYLGMEVLGISMVTNMAAGILEQPLSHAEVVETAARATPALAELLHALLPHLLPGPRSAAADGRDVER
jgi:purine-nucleoside phosphorylase